MTLETLEAARVKRVGKAKEAEKAKGKGRCERKPKDNPLEIEKDTIDDMRRGKTHKNAAVDLGVGGRDIFEQRPEVASNR